MKNKRHYFKSRFKRRFKPTLAIEFGIIFLVGVFTFQVQAATFAPGCSTVGLIAAIDSANGNGEANIINLPADCTIVLDSIHNTVDGNNGLPDITSDITINGNGGTIERNPTSGSSFRIWHISSGGKLTLNNITIQQGSEPGAEGGGIYNLGTLNLFDSTIGNNYNDYGGAGIYTDGGTVTISNSTISNNHTDYGGGGIRQVSGTLTITDSVVYGNNSSYGGGGININNGVTELIISRCYIMNNTAQTSGGGVSGNEIYGGGITITDSYIVNNQAGFYGFGGGGGISLNFSYAELISIENSTISYNISVGGGGAISHSNSFTPLSICNCTINDNESNYSGGAISSVSNGFAQLTIDHSTFFSNKAKAAGGAIHTSSLFDINECFFFRNISGYENDGQGGGGAINFPSSDAVGSISDCSFADNSAGLDGGGVHSYAIVSFANCIFSNNIAPNGSGDDICLAGGSMKSNNLILGSNLAHGIDICKLYSTQYLSISQTSSD